MRQTREQLIELLDTMREAILHDDSFGGRLTYEVTPEYPVFEVEAAIRVGNSEGQGGTILLERTPENGKDT